MKGVLQVTRLFIGGDRFQRALLAAFPVMQCLAILWYLLDPPCQRCVPTGPMVCDSVALMGLTGCLLMGAERLRAMAAPRTLRFAPLARLRLLLGMVLALLLLAGLLTFGAALAYKFAPRLLVSSGSVYGTFCGAVELMFLWVLWGFFLFGRAVWLRWLLVVAIFPAVLVMGLQFVGGPGGGALVEFSAIGLAAVISFVTWFVRVRQIEPPDPVVTGTDWSVFAVARVRSSEVLGKSAEAATNTYLLGQPTVARACWFWLSCVIAVNIFWLGLMRLPRAYLDSSVAFPIVLVGVILCATIFPHQIVRRARMLWIRGGSSRRELFNRTEKLSLDCLAFVGIPLLVLGAAELTHVSLDRAVYLLLLTVSTGLCCIYLTLLDLRFRINPQFNPLELVFFTVTYMFFLPDVFYFPFEHSDPWVPLQVPIVELLAVPLLRAIALHRWQRIDWLICKLPKSASQRLRLAR